MANFTPLPIVVTPTNSNLTKMSLTFPESQLNPETARKTAKAFANIFYAQQQDNDAANFTLERQNLIRFLKTWGTHYVDKHIPIDANLCTVLLKQLNVETNEVEEIVREFEKEVVVKKAVVPPRKCLADEFNRRCEKIKARQKRKDFVQKFDQDKLGSFAVKTTVFFNDLVCFEKEEDNAIVVLDEKCGKTLLLNKNERKKQILLCYSILNLKKVAECCDLLKNTLARCAKEDSLLIVEKEFIYYLWEHLKEIPDDVASQLFDNFGFLYEKPILKACTAILKTDAITNDADLTRIAQTSQLFDRVAAIFCDLFLLSGRNNAILILYEKMYCLQ